MNIASKYTTSDYQGVCGTVRCNRCCLYSVPFAAL